MALRLDLAPRGRPTTTFDTAKVFLLGFFLGETFLLILLGVVNVGH